MGRTAGDRSLSRRIDRALQVAGLPPLQRSVWIEVDVDQLIRNTTALLPLAGQAALGAVVKADGYGHGLEVAGRCAMTGGARWLCVADAGEATRLRNDGYRGRVFVLYPVPTTMLAHMAELEVDVTAGSLDDIADMTSRLSPETPTLAVHLEIDTGMTRGGVRPDEILTAASILTTGGTTRHAGTWTHLAAPEDPLTTRAQLDRFETALGHLSRSGLGPGVVHAMASGGLLVTNSGRHDLVRPGLSFYGVHPGPGEQLPAGVAPALSIRAHPVRVATVPRGTAVGYGGTWITARESVIATLPIGYADGWSRSSSPGGNVLVHGRRAPLVGRVSSDSLTVDVTEIDSVGPGSEFTLLGDDGDDEITTDEVAAVRGTISWEVLQQLGSRLTRVFTSAATPVALRPETSLEIVTGKGWTLTGY